MDNLPQFYHDQISRSIDEKGVFPHQMITAGQDGKMGMYALMLPEPHQVLNAMLQALVKDKPKELIYGMDRYAKAGQGTTLGDLIGGAYWNGDAWRVFTIEYQHEPRIVEPLDWNNEFWKNSIRQELTQFLDVAFAQKKNGMEFEHQD